MTTPPPEPAPAEHVTDLDAVRRLRVLEERFMNLRRKAQLSDEKLLAAEQKLATELKALTQEFTDLHHVVIDLQESINTVKAEMGHAASQYDLKALEKYVGYWEPMQFVTKDELLRKENLLKERTGKEK